MTKQISAQDIETLRTKNPGAYFQLLEELSDRATNIILDVWNSKTRKVRTVAHDGRRVYIYFTGALYASNFCSDIEKRYGIEPVRKAETYVIIDARDTIKL